MPPVGAGVGVTLENKNEVLEMKKLAGAGVGVEKWETKGNKHRRGRKFGEEDKAEEGTPFPAPFLLPV